MFQIPVIFVIALAMCFFSILLPDGKCTALQISNQASYSKARALKNELDCTPKKMKSKGGLNELQVCQLLVSVKKFVQLTASTVSHKFQCQCKRYFFMWFGSYFTELCALGNVCVPSLFNHLQ